MTPKEVYDKAIKQWGEPLQMIMAIEECNELIVELCKRFRSRCAPEDAVIAEMNKSASIMKGHCKRMRNAQERYGDIFVVVPMNTDTLSEEMGDVEVMLGQLKVMNKNTDEVTKHFMKKIRKLDGWLNGKD